MTEQNETPLTMEEALLRRQGEEPATEPIPEPTQDEIIQAGLREAELMEQLSDLPQGEDAIPSPPIPTSTNSTTPEIASIGDPPPADKTSIPESQEKTVTMADKLLGIRPLDSETYIVAEFLAGPDFSVHYVERQLATLSTIPEMIPPPNQWALPAEVDLPKLIYETILTPGFVTQVWPIVRMLMGTSIGNVVWEVKVICTIAFMEVTRMVGLAHG